MRTLKIKDLTLDALEELEHDLHENGEKAITAITCSW